MESTIERLRAALTPDQQAAIGRFVSNAPSRGALLKLCGNVGGAVADAAKKIDARKLACVLVNREARAWGVELSPFEVQTVVTLLLRFIGK